MIVENKSEVAQEIEKIVNGIVVDLNERGISDFGKWLREYDNTIDEVENILINYVKKVNSNRISEIERWENVVMLNSVALYVIEMGLDEVPVGEEIVDKLFKIYVSTVQDYIRMKRGRMKLVGSVFISDISLFQFVEI